MQVDERRACPSCSADNAHDAEFCWQCYARFVPVPPAPTAGQPLGWGPSGTPAPSGAVGTPAPAPASRGGSIVKAVVGIVVVLVVGAVVRNLLTPNYHVPEAVGGQPRIHDATTARLEQDMMAEGDKSGLKIEAAVYGANGDPDVLFILVNGQAAENTDELFASFLDGIAASGVTVDRNAATTGSYHGAEWRCLPLTASRLDTVACMWREDASVGMTLDLSPVSDPSEAMVAAYDATHA
jgi:hypothetical protein